MYPIESWVAERLNKISYNRFGGEERRHFSLNKLHEVSVTYYEVPLSTGGGNAFLSVPKYFESAQRSLIILMHGLGDDCSYPLLHWIRVLNANGMSVLSFDWDGHGVGGSSVLDFQQATRSLPLLLFRLFGEESRSGLSAKRDGPSCFLMGHSMGASLALIAATRPDVARNISGVIAVSPALNINSYSKAAGEVWNYLYPSAWLKDFLNKFTYYGFDGLFPATGSFMRKSFPLRMRTAIGYVDQARNFVNETFEKRRILREVRIPVLWMHGMKDRIAPYPQVASLMMEIPSAFFAHNDEKRGHLRMAFSDQIPKYCSTFIKQCYDLKTINE
ncbi:alpha/beta hydrolase [Fluviispira multicolorata]|uniref:Alpha/beta fold hydrolase n=1 Tax=Fluviispira multicolorata TaxID=2654512 RepID=A0A833N5V0_9BACT|nr:alpha/beta fold hydrolase [Fluviispira multicolorata]KAB8031749.1 alpha/beta fold hydrolase [Fluviispira multicolorata]